MYALPLTWFQERVDHTIYRDGRPVTVVSEAAAPYLHDMQKDGFFFSDTAEIKKPATVKIHQGPPASACFSCEG